MTTIRFSGRRPSPDHADIGMEGDQRSGKLRFLLPQISDGQSAQLMMILPDDTPEILQIRGGMAVIPAHVAQIPGRSRCWVEILGRDHVAWNSEPLYLDVGDLPPISERTEQQYPTAIQDAMNACALSELYMNEARAAAGFLTAAGGLMHMTIEDDGNLYMYFTHNTPVKFELIEGELYAYGA